ncbi:vWA domain-containing protein [Orenia marismortui]|uniref:Ca-activated chloride channel family protein n=1 Tax=Orenia marismortui TaxID=46469 RepID=A0A4V3GYD6_9FIRM|nr:vWA domain-containing protein [Orenia marismortui]TDX51676.1 Ca-activated chloride channel family protein [Orenia marismortui]
MRLKQNLTLVILIIILLSAIFSINTLNIITIPTNKKVDKEIKVNTNQRPLKYNKINVEIIWDLSGSMWGEIEEKNKINTSKKILNRIINDFPKEINIGLRVFGSKESNREGSYLAIPIKTNTKKDILNFIDQVKPLGKSPIALNLSYAGEDLKYLQGKKHILLITDGKDTGNIMPSKVINRLSKLGIKTHIIQVGKIDKYNQLKLKELSKLGNGKYFTYFEEEEIVPTINLN